MIYIVDFQEYFLAQIDENCHIPVLSTFIILFTSVCLEDGNCFHKRFSKPFEQLPTPFQIIYIYITYIYIYTNIDVNMYIYHIYIYVYMYIYIWAKQTCCTKTERELWIFQPGQCLPLENSPKPRNGKFIFQPLEFAGVNSRAVSFRARVHLCISKPFQPKTKRWKNQLRGGWPSLPQPRTHGGLPGLLSWGILIW